ncbi:MAG TPA: tail fiber domain-containing protein [Bacteroidia bacterium]|nr:tail fiber domain-containing protein [Bacteroidia bacterium]
MKKIIFFSIICLICARAQGQWSLTGNAGTNPSTNFVGTKDAKNLKIRTNNVIRMNITSGGKVAIGNFTPAHKLDVGGSINTNSDYRIDGDPVIATPGIANTFLGRYSGTTGATGGYNSSTGHSALDALTTGYENTAHGAYALSGNTTGHENTGIGSYALFSNTIGMMNTATGAGALFSNTEGLYNCATGYRTLYLNIYGFENTASGNEALHDNVSGNRNTAIGVSALFHNNGSRNTACGALSLIENTTGESNTAIGANSLHDNQTGSDNTAAGENALSFNTTGYQNSACGVQALFVNQEGAANTACGYQALALSEASRNTAVGNEAGADYGHSNYNTFVGAYCDANTAGFSNSAALGDGSVISASNQARIGDAGVNSIGGYAGWTTLPSDGRFKKNIREDVKGLDFIVKLRPVTYTLDVRGVNQYIGANETGKESIYDEKSRIRYTGFIAQEVEKAAKETGFDFSGVDAPKNDRDVYGLRYAEFVVPLVKAVQELSKENDDLKSEVRGQKAENEKLKNEINEIRTALGLQPKSSGILPITIGRTSDFLLEQNSPNPFNTQTEIKFRLPATFNSAQLIITDVNGRQVRKDVLTYSSSVIIKAAELAAGTYSYSLVIDGINMGTKQMILTK